MSQLPETKEDYSSKIPALRTLMNLGWTYLNPAECLKKRGSNRDVLLKDELIAHLKAYRFDHKGEATALSTNAIEQVVREVAAPGLHDGLGTANERIYDRLCLGITVAEFIDGKKRQLTVPIIDWDCIEKNSFQVTEELEVLSTHGTHTRRPDIVCFVNGIPLVVIECKRPESGNPNKSMVDEGISQTLRNQLHDEIPQLFTYAQLLLAISSTDGLYGTTLTKKKFWAQWRDEELSEEDFNTTKNAALDEKTVSSVLNIREKSQKAYFLGLWEKPQLPTAQDRLLSSLISPTRLLEFVRFYILFDKKVGKIAARYQQVFGIKALLKRIDQRNSDGGREGGVIWHTTGSGKSFTMVLLTKALLLHRTLKECRVIVVTDRVDLEKQLSRTFLSSGAFGSAVATKKDGAKARVTTGRDLAKRIGQGNERIIFSIINKFNTASKQSECFNPSDNIIVLIDEGHRSQGGENHERMRKALPNAAYVAFTGTPLLKDDKTTNKFGPIVHAYTMQRAVEDKTVTPLLYEERKQLLDVNDKAIDNWFETLTSSLSAEQQNDLKKKFSKKSVIYGAENRIALIALDIALHFTQHVKHLGLKGQLATDCKLSAIRYKTLLDATGLVSSAVIISPPDSREGHEEVDEAAQPEVLRWWKDAVGGQNPEHYERDVIESFASDGDPDILIVVDKLLTGFDEPKNTVLYIDKSLKQHNLIQAIARVNRLHEEKPYGLLIDYRGILKELDTAIKDYHDLEERTQGGYDIEDLEGLYAQMSTEYKRLPTLHSTLWAVFSSVLNRQDLEQYRQILVPKNCRNDDGDDYDSRQSVREDFYEALTEFGMCLKLALSSRSFFEDKSFSDETIQEYKNDLRFFINLRKMAKQDAQETVDYSAYDKQIRHLVDKHVVGEQVIDAEGQLFVTEMGANAPEEWSEEKARNETDIIKTRTKKSIEQNLADDPYAQRVFSELLKEAISEAESLFDYPHKQYALFDELEKKLARREVDGIPAELSDNRHAQAFYGAMRLGLGDEAFEALTEAESQKLTDDAIATDSVVKQAVAEHSLNPQNIEAAIRNELLPRMYAMAGMQKASIIIDKIIEITRVGLSKGAV